MTVVGVTANVKDAGLAARPMTSYTGRSHNNHGSAVSHRADFGLAVGSIPLRLTNLINTSFLGTHDIPCADPLLCATSADGRAPSVGRLSYSGTTFVISFDVLMLAVIFHWRV